MKSHIRVDDLSDIIENRSYDLVDLEDTKKSRANAEMTKRCMANTKRCMATTKRCMVSA